MPTYLYQVENTRFLFDNKKKQSEDCLNYIHFNFNFLLLYNISTCFLYNFLMLTCLEKGMSIINKISIKLDYLNYSIERYIGLFSAKHSSAIVTIL
jgi:hypothetical protein